eukprot:2966087-Pyramimonas_sp.AAC.1
MLGNSLSQLPIPTAPNMAASANTWNAKHMISARYNPAINLPLRRDGDTLLVMISERYCIRVSIILGG